MPGIRPGVSRIGVIAGSLVLAAGVAALPAAGATASASCGTIHHGSARATDIHAVSAVTCSGARSVLTTWLSLGKYPAPHSGWHCTAHAGAYDCKLHAPLGTIEQITFHLHT